MTQNYEHTRLLDGVRPDGDLLGLKFIDVKGECASFEAVQKFIAFLQGLAAQSGAPFEYRAGQSVDHVQGTSLQWTRYQFMLYPLLIERLTVVPAEEFFGEDFPVPISRVRPGEWLLSADVVNDSPNHFSTEPEVWRTLFMPEISEQISIDGGLAMNVLEIPAQALASRELEIRPVVLHAMSEEGLPCDRGNPAAQAAIANAFWQTFWATGARRAERGATFPVAFLPVDRSWKGECLEPFRCLNVSESRQLYGRTAILAYLLEEITRARALCFDRRKQEFALASGLAATLPAEWVALALTELNRSGFIDAYTGDNRELFGSELMEGQVRIHRVVPYAGCAFLNQVVNDRDALERSGKMRIFEGEILAATNSTFFLNFPEEYGTLHSAMNDPVALLVEGGETMQVATLDRATFVLAESGEPLITTSVSNALEFSGTQQESDAVIDYFAFADRGFSGNFTPEMERGYVFVGPTAVESFSGRVEVPSSGVVVACSQAVEGIPRLVPVARREDGTRVPIRHAFAVGPLLVKDGQIVTLGASGEEFMSIKLRENPSFEETSVLARTEIPGPLLECDARGVPPTRFPYDWDRTRAPRTSIGVKGDGSVLLVVVDGRADLVHSVGATLRELAQIMLNLGCVSALNMDGGGSSVMFVNDETARKAKLRADLREGIVNLPSDLGGVERLLPVPLVICSSKHGRS